MKHLALTRKLLCILSLFIIFLQQAHAAPLAEKEVFELSSQITGPNTLMFNWQIKPGNFLYKDRFSFKISNQQHLGPVQYPTTFVKKTYPQKSYDVYRNDLNLPLALLNEKPGTFNLSVTHQGCADTGFCYPPTQNTFKIKVNDNLEMVSVTQAVHTQKVDKKTIKEKNAVSAPALVYQTLFEKHNLFFIIFSFYGFGLLLAFTPCVLPMVPVLSGIIVGQHKNISSRKALFLSISYVLGMAITYAGVGIIIAALGQNLQTIFQSPITIGLFACLFVVLALSMFDFYALSLPQSWQLKLAKSSNSQNSGAYIGAASMGALSTLILSPCVTAPLVGALTYIAKTSDMLLGGLSLFFLGLGMGTPLIIIGASAGKLLPKAGNWMNHIKHLFGIILIAIAISLTERIAPASLTMTAWSALLIFCGLFICLLNKKCDSGTSIFSASIGLMLFIYGILVLIGVALGNSSPYHPLVSTHRVEINKTIKNSHFPKKITVDNLGKASKIISDAKKGHKKVFIDFYADWCASCLEMESEVFNDPNVLNAMKDIIWLKVNVTNRNQNSKNLERNFNVIAPPTFILLDDKGEESSRMIGKKDKTEVIKALN